MQTKTRRSSEFTLYLSTKEDGTASGTMCGASGGQSFRFGAVGKDFEDLLKKFEGMFPEYKVTEFYYGNEPGPITAGDGSEPSAQSVSNKPPNCT